MRNDAEPDWHGVENDARAADRGDVECKEQAEEFERKEKADQHAAPKLAASHINRHAAQLDPDEQRNQTDQRSQCCGEYRLYPLNRDLDHNLVERKKRGEAEHRADANEI